ncbi:MAG TPA: GNAT family N-acetyltransferase [Steroidobacteraceae bacterium]|nr:GNAT family N-acetyltransferase [Steroidobacteraceae bacterium]
MIHIAPLRLPERARWAQLWSEYQLFYRVELPAAVSESTWQRLHNGRVHGLGARNSDDYLVGIVHFLFHEDTWSAAPACYLQDLYVDSTARGTGCGRMLIEAVAKSARKAGANSPYWLTHENNAVARRLYDRLGRNQGFIQYTYVTHADAERAR